MRMTTHYKHISNTNGQITYIGWNGTHYTQDYFRYNGGHYPNETQVTTLKEIKRLKAYCKRLEMKEV